MQKPSLLFMFFIILQLLIGQEVIFNISLNSSSAKRTLLNLIMLLPRHSHKCHIRKKKKKRTPFGIYSSCHPNFQEQRAPGHQMFSGLIMSKIMDFQAKLKNYNTFVREFWLQCCCVAVIKPLQPLFRTNEEHLSYNANKILIV